MAMRSVGTARAIDALPALPGAERELAALAAAIGADGSQLLIGADATEGRLRATPIPSGAVLAFATHGLLSGELDGLDEPALLLTPADSSEERRVGKAGVSTCRSRVSPARYKKNTNRQS